MKKGLRIPQRFVLAAGPFLLMVLVPLLFASVADALAHPLDHWTWRNPKPQGNYLSFVSFSDDVFVALGSQVLSSSDATNWNVGAAPNVLYGVTHANAQFVAVGADGGLFSSTNGLDWAAEESGISNALFAVTYAAGQFVAVGWGGTILVSTNATKWTARTANTSETLLAITYGYGKFVAVGARGAIVTSPDGSHWYARNSGTVQDLGSVTYGAGQFMAVDGMKGIVSSTNGVDWSSKDVPVTDWLNLYSITYGQAGFVAVDGYGKSVCSTNGVDWVLGNSGTGVALRSVVFGKGRYLSVGDGGVIITSLDGLHWDRRDSGWRAFVTSLAYGTGTFVAVGTGGAISTSSNRVDWVPVPTAITNDISSVSRINGRFLAVGYQIILSSEEGRTWIAHSPTLTNRIGPSFYNLTGLAYGAGRYVAQGYGLFTGVFNSLSMSSTNGEGWDVQQFPTNGELCGLAYGNGLFVSFWFNNLASYVSTSKDGLQWNWYDISTDHVAGLAFGNGTFMAVSQSGLVLTSQDGQNWQRQSNAFGENSFLLGLTYGNGEFVTRVYQGTGKVTFASPDGVNWIAHASAPEFSSLVYAGNHFFGLGPNGVIVESDSATTTVHPLLSIAPFEGKQPYRFNVSGYPGQLYLIEGSVDFLNWIPLRDVQAGFEDQSWVDPSLTNLPVRFYRAIAP